MPLRLAILFLIVAAVLGACGQKGPLVMPPDAPADEPATVEENDE